MKNKDDDKSSNIGSIFKGIDKFINIVADMIENEKNEIDVKGILNDPENKKRIVTNYGFNVKLGGENVGGLKDINTMQNIRNNNDSSGSLYKVIEPVTDLFNEEDKLIIVMELPGVQEESIKLEIDEDILKVSGYSKDKNYIKNIKLQFNPSSENIVAKFNNSIYSIIVKKNND